MRFSLGVAFFSLFLLMNCTKRVTNSGLDGLTSLSNTEAPICQVRFPSSLNGNTWNAPNVEHDCADNKYSITSYSCKLLKPATLESITVNCDDAINATSWTNSTTNIANLSPGVWRFVVEATNTKDLTGSAFLVLNVDKAPPLLSSQLVGSAQAHTANVNINIAEPSEPQPQSGVKDRLCALSTTSNEPDATLFQNCSVVAPNGILSNLNPNQNYFLHIRGIDNAGNTSASGSVLSFSTPPVSNALCSIINHQVTNQNFVVNYQCPNDSIANECSFVQTSGSASYSTANCNESQFTKNSNPDGIYQFCVKSHSTSDESCLSPIVIDNNGPNHISITDTDAMSNNLQFNYTATDALQGVDSFRCGLRELGDLNAACGDPNTVTLSACSNNCSISDQVTAHSRNSCQKFQGLNYNKRYQFVVQARDSSSKLSSLASQCIALPFKETITNYASLVLTSKYNNAWISTLNPQSLQPVSVPFNYQSSPSGLTHSCELKNLTNNTLEYNGSCSEAEFEHIIDGNSGDTYRFTVSATGAGYSNIPQDTTTFRLDNNPPLVTISNISTAQYGPSGVSIPYSITDVHSGVDTSKSQCKLVNSQSNFTQLINCPTSNLIQIPYSTMNSGTPYYISIKSTDFAGNVSQESNSQQFYARAPYVAPNCNITPFNSPTAAASVNAHFACSGANNAPLSIMCKVCGTSANGSSLCSSFSVCQDGRGPLVDGDQSITNSPYSSGPVTFYVYAVDEDSPNESSAIVSQTYTYNKTPPTISNIALNPGTTSTVGFTLTPSPSAAIDHSKTECWLRKLASENDSAGEVLGHYSPCASPQDIQNLGKEPGTWYSFEIKAVDTTGLSSNSTYKWRNGNWSNIMTETNNTDNFVYEYKLCNSPVPTSNGFNCELENGFALVAGSSPLREQRKSQSCASGFHVEGATCVSNCSGDIILSNNQVITGEIGSANTCSVTIPAGVTVIANESVIIRANNIVLNGNINGNGKGSLGGNGGRGGSAGAKPANGNPGIVGGAGLGRGGTGGDRGSGGASCGGNPCTGASGTHGQNGANGLHANAPGVIGGGGGGGGGGGAGGYGRERASCKSTTGYGHHLEPGGAGGGGAGGRGGAAVQIFANTISGNGSVSVLGIQTAGNGGGGISASHVAGGTGGGGGSAAATGSSSGGAAGTYTSCRSSRAGLSGSGGRGGSGGDGSVYIQYKTNSSSITINAGSGYSAIVAAP